MRRNILFGALVAVALWSCDPVEQKTITMDLSNPTTEIVYNETGVWNKTYAEDVPTIETQCFSISHLPSGNSWGGLSWEGFTVSKQADAKSAFACMAKGGIAGEGKPYLYGYYSAYMDKSCHIRFDKMYTPKEVYICNASATYTSMLNGDDFSKKFTESDSLVLHIWGINEAGERVGSIDAKLADGTNFITNWQKVILSSLEGVWGIEFTLSSSDNGDWGMNTPAYFAVDGLSVIE